MHVTVFLRLSFLALALLAGCATRPPVSTPAAEAVWLAHRSTLEALTHWQVQGRVGVRAGEDGWNASFDWQQQGEAYRIRLRGPFGQGAVELAGSAQGVWLTQADRPAVFASDAETLLQRETGWQLPVSGLGAWLRGLPTAAAQSELVWDEHGRLQQMNENGWRIEYFDYQRADALELPARMDLQRDTLRVKLVLDAWQVL
jgi:outer membrane lipoprotein LolB